MCLAVPGRVLGLEEGGHVALTDISGVRRRVNVDLLGDDVATGEWVLIHVGFAMSKISEAHAREQLHLLELLGERESVLEELEQTPGVKNGV